MQNKEKSRLKFLINFFYFGIIIAAVVLFFSFLFPALLPFIIGALIAYMVEPLVNFAHKKLKIPRKITSAIIILGVAGIGIYLLILLGYKLYDEASAIVSNSSGWIGEATALFDKVGITIKGYVTHLPSDFVKYIENMSQSLETFILSIPSNYGQQVINHVTKFVSSIPTAVLSVVISLIFAYFFSADLDIIKKFIRQNLPKKIRGFFTSTKAEVFKIVGQYFKSYGKILLITFAEIWIAFMILRIDYAITFAIIIAIFDILPILGTGGVLIPWALICFFTGDVPRGIGLAVTYLVILLVRQYIEPRIVGKQIGLHPVITLIAMFTGLRLLGLFGMFLFPITITLLKNLHDKKVINLVFWEKSKTEN